MRRHRYAMVPLLQLIHQYGRFDYNFETLIPLGEGFSSVAFMAQGLVFRVARTPSVLRDYAYEARFLEQLHRQLPLKVPEPIELIEFENEDWPGCFVTTFQDGKTLEEADCKLLQNESNTGRLADFIVGLQRLKLPDCLHRDQPGFYTRRFEFCLPELKRRLRPDQIQKLQAWFEHFLKSVDVSSHLVICHGDLWYGNLLVVPRGTGFSLSGVVDFEKVKIAHPAVDFARLNHVSEDFAKQVVEAVRTSGLLLPPNLEQQMQLQWQFQPFDGIQRSIVLEEEAELQDAIEKLFWQVGLL